MALDVLFQSAGDRVLSSATAIQAAFESLKASDPSEAVMMPSVALLDSMSGDMGTMFGAGSRAQSTCPVSLKNPASVHQCENGDISAAPISVFNFILN